MGGKNIIIVMDDANLDLAVDGAVWGGFGTTGQRCTAASRVAVHRKVYGEFVEKFVARVKALKVGDGLDPATDMGPCINEQQLNTVMKYVEIGKDEGAKLRRAASPGKRHMGTRVVPRADRLHRLRSENARMPGRNFRARGGVIPFEDFDEALGDRGRRELRAFGIDLHAERQ